MEPQTSRAPRVIVPLSIMYRRTEDDQWLQAKLVNLSESGALFGPSELRPGAAVELILSPPVALAGFAPGKQVCVAEVVRATELGTVAVRFQECRFLLEP